MSSPNKPKAKKKPEPPTKGRPSKYRDEYCEQLVAHMAQGLSFESFAGRIGVNRDTLYAWNKAHPAFSDAATRGSAACQLFWENVGRDGTMGMLKRVTKEEPVLVNGAPVAGPDGKPLMKRSYAPATFSANAWSLNMQNRFRWRTRMESAGGPPGSPPEQGQGAAPYASLSEAELDRRLQAEVADLKPSLPGKETV